MTIGIDFDDTCVDTWTITKKYLNEYFPDLEVDHPGNSPWDKEKIVMADHMHEIVYESKINDGLYEFIGYCKKKNIKLVLITARGGDFPKIIELTKDYIAKNHLHFDEMIFDADHKGNYKGKICKAYGVDLMIDDSKKVIEEVASYGIKVLRYGSIDEKYDYALNWHDALEYIKKGEPCE